MLVAGIRAGADFDGLAAEAGDVIEGFFEGDDR